MLKTILKKLNGHAVEASALGAALGAALTPLARDRREVEADLERLQKERHQSLLDDADDKALDVIERKIERAKIRLKTIDLAEPPLRARLATASSAERARRWADHVAAHRTAAAEFLVAARAVHTPHARLVDVVDAVRTEGFERNIIGYGGAGVRSP